MLHAPCAMRTRGCVCQAIGNYYKIQEEDATPRHAPRDSPHRSFLDSLWLFPNLAHLDSASPKRFAQSAHTFQSSEARRRHPKPPTDELAGVRLV